MHDSHRVPIQKKKWFSNFLTPALGRNNGNRREPTWEGYYLYASYILSTAGLADIVTLDGGDIYRAGKDHGLKVILGEVYNYNQPGSYWSVAVVHAGTSFNIHQLEVSRL